MPDTAQIEVEHVPAQALACLADDSRRAPDVRPAVQAKIRSSAPTREHDVIVAPVVSPVHRSAGRNGNHLRIEEIVLDTHIN